MCEVSDRFKLCSCNAEELEKATAIWQLFAPRPDEENNMILVGELVLPEDIDAIRDLQNQTNILRRLGEKDVFDFQPELKEGDLLVLFFRSSKAGYAAKEYSYTYHAGQWELSKSNYFDRENGYLDKERGKVLDPE